MNALIALDLQPLGFQTCKALIPMYNGLYSLCSTMHLCMIISPMTHIKTILFCMGISEGISLIIMLEEGEFNLSNHEFDKLVGYEQFPVLQHSICTY